MGHGDHLRSRSAASLVASHDVLGSRCSGKGLQPGDRDIGDWSGGRAVDVVSPVCIENILADFQLLDDWEDRYRYVIELGRALPPPTGHVQYRGCRDCIGV